MNSLDNTQKKNVGGSATHIYLLYDKSNVLEIQGVRNSFSEVFFKHNTLKQPSHIGRRATWICAHLILESKERII